MLKGKNSFDYYLLLITSLLTIVGIGVIYSTTTAYGYVLGAASSQWIINHLVWTAIGAFLLFVASNIDYHFYGRLDKLIIVLVILSLLLVFSPQFGQESRGVYRSIGVGFISFTPSEIAKLGVVIYLSFSLVKKKDKMENYISGSLPYFIILGVISILVVMEPDLCSALIIAMIGFVLLYAGGARISHLLYTFFLALVPLYFAIFEVGYRKSRILGFFVPEQDPLGTGFHPLYLKRSFNTGGLWGSRLSKGPEILSYLPTPLTDSIFAVIGEMWGFMGTTLVILLFIIFVLRGLRIAERAPDDLGKLLATGISCFIGGQALMNMGVATVLLPTAGSPLPLVSYGGSSLLVSFVSIGILLNISRQRKSGESHRTML